MLNFSFYNPVRVVFGKGVISQLSDLAPRDTRTLLLYGGGSIRQNGVYQQVMSALAGRPVLEFGGIRPNPPYEQLLPAVELVRRERIGFLLAVGGGSVVDATKFVASAALFEGPDLWELLAKRMAPKAALPFGVVLTLPATGSEMNSIAVISRTSTQEKLAFAGDRLFPQFSILDPQTTFSLPPRQIRNGVVDAFVHVMEQYMTYDVNAPLQHRLAESVLCTLMEEGPKTLARPTDYDARANVMWCATLALSGLVRAGVPTDFATHRIGHELTAFYGLEHAESLSALLLAVWQHQRLRKGAMLQQYARRVLGRETHDTEAGVAAAVSGTAAFFESLGMPTRLSAFGVDPVAAADRIAERCRQRQALFGEHNDITPEQVAELIRLCG